MGSELLVQALLDKLKHQEELLAVFYGMLIKLCPDYKKTWTYLSNQEKMHAKAIELLKGKFAQDQAFFNSELIHIKPLNYSIEFIESRTSELGHAKLSNMEMLEIALNLESNTMETIAFESISSNLEALENVLTKLRADTEQHKTVIKNAIKKEEENKPKGFKKYIPLLKDRFRF